MRGVSLIEVLVTVSLLSLLMAAAYSSLIMQMRAHAAQTLMAETMHQARSALQVLTDHIEMAGFGVPTATRPSVPDSLLIAEATRLRFWSDVATTHTYLTADALRNDRSVTVLTSAGLAAGDAVYLTDTTNWYFGTVTAVNGTTVQVSPPLTYNFTAGSLLNPVEQVTFELADGELRRNGRPFIPNVAALEFTYDSQTLREVRVITIELTVETRATDVNRGRPLEVTVRTQVAPPNLAL